MNALVSVIIPAYNSEKYIVETIESVLNQTWKQIEIIVIDDGSSDETFNRLANYTYSRLKIYTQENKGACAARNLGFKYSNGEFIQFLDADDILAPDKIEQQVKQLTSQINYSKIISHGQWGRFYHHTEETIKWGPHEDIRKHLKPADWLISDQMSMTGCWLTPRSLIELGGLWDESLKRNQDGEYFSRLISHGQKVMFCQEAKVFYRSGLTSSVSGDTSKPAALSALKTIDLIKGYTLALENSNRARLAMANKYMDFAFAHFLSYPELALTAEKNASELGGANLRLVGGILLKVLEIIFGWKTALKVRSIVRQFV